MRTSLGNAKDSTLTNIAAVCNLSPLDPRFTQRINEAQQRLIQTKEIFYGLHQKMQFCVTAGCLVLPRQVASVETMSVCDRPIPVRNRWFEYLETGIGIRGDGSCGSASCDHQLLDRGETCCFADIIGTGNDKTIKVYTDVTESASAIITLYGYDENGQWIRTLVSGTWIDGEQVSLSGGPHTTTKNFTSLTGVQKPITNGPVRLYEYDTVLTTQRAIAIYESDETHPSYRKKLLTGIDSNSSCADCDSGEVQVTAMVRLEFIPARVDTDWLLIGNLPALKDEVQSILKYENNLPQEGAFWHAKAIQTLREEFRHYNGYGSVNPIRLAPSNISGPGVPNLV